MRPPATLIYLARVAFDNRTRIAFFLCLWDRAGVSAWRSPRGVERISHGYDRASNRRWRGCPVPAGPASPVYRLGFLPDPEITHDFSWGKLSCSREGLRRSDSRRIAYDRH
jgi:hypothetical protein